MHTEVQNEKKDNIQNGKNNKIKKQPRTIWYREQKATTSQIRSSPVPLDCEWFIRLLELLFAFICDRCCEIYYVQDPW